MNLRYIANMRSSLNRYNARLSAAFKAAARELICSLLEWQVTRLRRRVELRVIAVAGSVGKTSTKLAIAAMLGDGQRLIYQRGNYNDRVTVPLVIFGRRLPDLFDIVAWIKLLAANEAVMRRGYPYRTAVVELGVDGPGQMKHFAYLRPDIVVITALTAEHIEQFGTLEAAVREELIAAHWGAQVLINTDEAPTAMLQGLRYSSYSLDGAADYSARTVESRGLAGQTVEISLRGQTVRADTVFVGRQGLKIVLAAAAAAHLLGQSPADIIAAIGSLKPFDGRMNILSGVLGGTIIDDTYNASPAAVIAGLDVLYDAAAPQRIAILGSMNELGDYSPQAHREVGRHCDPKRLDWVVTIGADAGQYLAAAAAEQGCRVRSFVSPYDAGEFVRAQLVQGAVVLAEGSQNGVFAEEALKPLLADPADAGKLVRQNAYWLRQKQTQFGA